MANFLMDGYDFDRTESRAKADWATLTRLRDMWPGKLVVKGVLDAEDAIALKSAGVDAVQVSSHGSRQLESAPPPILELAKIRDAVGPERIETAAQGERLLMPGFSNICGFLISRLPPPDQVSRWLDDDTASTIAPGDAHRYLRAN